MPRWKTSTPPPEPAPEPAPESQYLVSFMVGCFPQSLVFPAESPEAAMAKARRFFKVKRFLNVYDFNA